MTNSTDVFLGEPVWARHDPPLMPWLLRRNEVLIDVHDPGSAALHDALVR